MIEKKRYDVTARVNDVFALREDESLGLQDKEGGRTLFAVRMVSVEFPPGHHALETKDDPPEKVQLAAVIACKRNENDLWQWILLSPPTKELVGDQMLEAGLNRDTWYFAERVDLIDSSDLQRGEKGTPHGK